MNQNIQRLIQSLSPQALKQLNEYVVDNMSEEIRQASIHGTVNAEMQNQLDELIIKYLEKNYPDDLKHTIDISEQEVREKIGNLVDNSLKNILNESTAPIVKPENTITQEDTYLGENTGYDQVHDTEERFFGLQYKLYLFLSKFDDDDTESYIRILLVITVIGMVLGFWNLFSDYSTANSMQEYYKHKNSVYMLHLADYCQHTMSKVEIFKQCVSNRQVDLIHERRIGMIKHLMIGIISLISFSIIYFLKLNYRGRDAYLNRDQ